MTAPTPEPASKSWFKQWRLEWSFAVPTIVLVMILIGTTMMVVHFRLRASLNGDLDLRGESMARSIGAVATPSLLAYNYAALQLAAEASSQDTGVAYVVLHDKEGTVAGAAGRLEPPRPGQDLLRSVRLERSALTLSVVDGHGGVEDVREVAVPVRVEGSAESWGTVRVGLSTKPMAEELRRIDLGLAGMGLALGFLAAACARWLARQITAPLRRLVAGTEALASGDIAHRIPVSGAKELVELARAFNAMMDKVQEKVLESQRFQHQLASLNVNLEHQVYERTRALQESEAQYKTLVEHSPDAILIVQDGKVRFVNPVFEETFGIPRVAALSPDFDIVSIFESSYTAQVRERIAGWESGARPIPLEVRAHDGSGSLRVLELRGSGIEYLGRPAAECILIDTTETNELRERLNETEKLRSLGELAGGVAHDFNNLLGAILGRAQLLRRRGFEVGVDAELAVIEKAARDGRETVRRIQEFSRVRRDRRFTGIDLSEILQDALEMTRTRWKTEAESRNIRIDVVVDAPPVPPIQGNATELRELFINLILNAVDAMPRGGTLSFSCKEEGNRVVVRAADTGIGMTEGVRRHLFDPFFTTKGAKGMGLGMSVVYGIVSRHEGTIQVQTEPEKGTTFLIGFPKAGPVHVEESVAPPVVGQTVRPARILVIDDEPAIAELLRDVLATQGHAVEIALSAREGVKAALSQPFDVVFTDLGMPEMSGWEVAAAIRASRPNIPVALVTGWAASIEESQIRHHRIAAMIHKPFEIAEVIQTTSEILYGTPVSTS